MRNSNLIFTFLIILAGTFIKTNAQQVQVGFSAGINSTSARLTLSTFDKSKFISKPSPGLTIGIPVYIKLENNLALKTGVGFQLRRYQIIQNQFDIPNLVGSLSFGSGFGVGEVPILVSFKPISIRKTKLEFLAGGVFSINSLLSTSISSSIDESEEPVLLSISSGNDFVNNSYSADFYLGISLGKYKNNNCIQQLTLAYQYGIIPLARSSFTTTIATDKNAESHFVVVKPMLSSIILSYAFYPKKWIF